MKSKLGTLLLLTLMLVSMGVVTYAGSYTHQVGNFYNQHVQSGMENIGYEVISPSYTNKTEMDFDCNSIISTGTFKVGFAEVDSEGKPNNYYVGIRTVTVSSTSQNLDKIYETTLSGTKDYKVYMRGDNGVHLIMNKAIVYYN